MPGSWPPAGSLQVERDGWRSQARVPGAEASRVTSVRPSPGRDGGTDEDPNWNGGDRPDAAQSHVTPALARRCGDRHGDELWGYRGAESASDADQRQQCRGWWRCDKRACVSDQSEHAGKPSYYQQERNNKGMGGAED